jgi:hypothetical protein
MNNTLFGKFAPVIRALSPTELAGASSLDDKLCIAHEGSLAVCYTPFEYVNPQASVVIVGITPGRTQLVNAVRELRRQLDLGAPETQALRAAKLTGAFSGAMRPNLVCLLDAIGLQRWLGLRTCADLFGSASGLVQTTSVLRNAVFVAGENYNGTPNMTRSPLLQREMLEGFGADARQLPQAVYLPLGDKVGEALHWLADRGVLDRSRILAGLPHPSGANAERIAYFVGSKSREHLSRKTDPHKLDAARTSLCERVAALA